HPIRARRGLEIRHCFQRLAVSPGESHGGVARYARGKAVRIQDRHLRKAQLDPLVRVAEALLEPQYLLPDNREAEVSRLNDSGVNRPDGNLVYPLPGNTHELIFFSAGRRLLVGRSRWMWQRLVRGWPRGVAQPRARVDICRAQTGQIP